MIMPAGLRKFALTAHITFSVGWLGAVAAFLVLSIAGLASQNAQTVRSAYLAMELIAWFVIVPLAVVSLLTGLLQSLGTKWGLFRHYWVSLKFLITTFATIILLTKLKLVSFLAGAATETALSVDDFRQLRLELLVHAGGGLLVLLVPMVLSVYKPWGLTSYGRRKQEEVQKSLPVQRATPALDSEKAPTDKRPLTGLKIAVIIICIIAAVITGVHIMGGSPGGHGH